MSLTHRFFLIVSLPVLICLVALSVLLYSFSRQELENEYKKRLLSEAEEIQHHVKSSVNLAKSDLATLSADRLLEHYFMYGYAGELDYQEDVRASLEGNFLEASKAKPKYASLRVFTMGGDAIANITEQKRAYKYPDPKNAEWFKIAKGLKPDEIYVSPSKPCADHQEPSIYICKLFYYWGKPHAIVNIHLHMQEYFAYIINEDRKQGSEEIFMLGEKGEIVVHCSEDKHVRSPTNPEILKRILTGSEKYYLADNYSYKDAVREIYFPTAIVNIAGVIVSPLSVITASTEKLRSWLQRIVILTSLILLGLLYLAARTIVGPLSNLEAATQNIAGGDLSARVNMERDDEIGSLAKSFDEMAENLERSQRELKKALAEVKTLSGFLPICASCKKIRDDKGYWNQIESYISKHSEAMFSHSICPDCSRKLYPEYYDEEGKLKNT